MVTFILLAAVLIAAAVLAVAIPLLRRVGKEPPAGITALATGLGLVAGSLLLYLLWSNWRWQDAALAGADTPQNMVARLARRLESRPDNLQGWLMLGRSYLVLQEYPLAVRAFQRADRLSAGRSAEALLGEAEGLATQDADQLDGRAGQLIDRALLLEPTSPRAVFFGATLAQRRGNLPLARERFAQLLRMNLPDSLRPVLEQQLAALDARLGASTHAAHPGAAVSVTVKLAPALADRVGQAPLFVFVRDPARPGPPLAARRLAAHFPQSVTLTVADAMIPDRHLEAGQQVQVIARIARSGGPGAASGDPFGEVPYTVGHDGNIVLTVDRVTP